MATAKEKETAETASKGVSIFIPEDVMNPENKVVEGHVNGRFFQVQRGVVTVVPEDIAEVLTFKRIAQIIAG